MQYTEYQLTFQKPAVFELVRDALETLGVWKIEANQFQVGEAEFTMVNSPGYKFVESIRVSLDSEDQEVVVLDKVEKALEAQGLVLHYFSTKGETGPQPYDPFNL